MKKEKFLEAVQNAERENKKYIAIEFNEGRDDKELRIYEMDKFDKQKERLLKYSDEEMMFFNREHSTWYKVTGIAAGNEYVEIERYLDPKKGYKTVINEAIDEVVEEMIKKYPDMPDERKRAIAIMTEAQKEIFLQRTYTVGQKRYIETNKELMKEIFDKVLNGNKDDFIEVFTRFTKELNKNV